jgi:MFS transporter, SP family, arabinose:H+ symporter
MKYRASSVWTICLHIVLSGIIFSYTQGVFNTSANSVASCLEWGSTKDTYIAVFTSFIPLGALLGALLAGNIMNTYGRRKATMFSDILFICSSSLTVIPTTATFGIGRLITGIAVGILQTVSPVFVNEIAPDEMIPQVGPLVQISTILGLVFAYSLGLPLPTGDYDKHSMSWWWIFMFLFPAVLATYQLFYFLCIHKLDTPLWLYRNGKNDEMMKALQTVYTEEGISIGLKRFRIGENENEELLNEDKEKHEDAELGKENKEDGVSIGEVIRSRRYRKMLRIGIALGIIQQLSGINAMVYYSTKVYDHLGESTFEARLLTVITGGIFFIASCFSLLILNFYGRKPVLIIGEILIAVDFIGLGILAQISGSPTGLMVLCVMLFFVIFSFSLGATLWIYLGETLIEKVASIAVAAMFFGDFVVSLAFPYMVDNVGLAYCAYFFAACMIASAFYCKYNLIETKDKTKPEIHELMFLDSEEE